MTDLRVAELFTGIGGVTGGFLDAGGFDAVFLNDADPKAKSVFVHNFPAFDKRYHVERVEKLTGKKMLNLAGGDIDGLLGCPPCQGLSPAGLRAKQDKRNSLLHEMHRLIWATMPKFFVLENVPGLLKTAIYRHFAESLGRRFVLHGEVVNAAEYGIPQLRRRATVIGLRKDLGLRPLMPKPTHGGCGNVFDYRTGKYVKPASKEGRQVLMLRPKVSFPPWPLITLRNALEDLPILASSEVSNCEYAQPPRTTYQQIMRNQAERIVTNHRAWRHYTNIVKLLQRVQPGDCPRQYGYRSRNTTYYSQAYSRLHEDGLARTITTNFHNPGSGRFTHYAAPRTLTIREALRLQGFPDTFKFEEDFFVTDAERLVGNAFPRLLGKVIGNYICHILL